MSPDDRFELLGYLAGALTTVAFVPQLILTLRTRATQGVSLRTYAVLSVGLLMWLLYGIAKKSPAIIIANAITLTLALSIVAAVSRFRHLKRKRG